MNKRLMTAAILLAISGCADKEPSPTCSSPPEGAKVSYAFTEISGSCGPIGALYGELELSPSEKCETKDYDFDGCSYYLEQLCDRTQAGDTESCFVASKADFSFGQSSNVAEGAYEATMQCGEKVTCHSIYSVVVSLQ